MPDIFDFSQKQPKSSHWLDNMPTVTFVLVALCVLITAPRLLVEQHFMDPPSPGTLLASMMNFGFEPTTAIWSGHYASLFTSFFPHGDIFHILFNMIWLVQLGSILELTIGSAWYLLFVVIGTMVGSGVEIALTGNTGIGASGAVYAIFGLMWAGRGRYPQWRSVANQQNFQTFVVWGVFCIIATFAGWMHVANGAHAGGFLFGLSVGWLFLAPRRRLIWAIPLGALIVLTILSATWMPWSQAWVDWKATSELERSQPMPAPSHEGQ